MGDRGWDRASQPLTPIPHPPIRFNLSNLIVGSEGTLAIILAAKIRLVPRPKFTAIDVVHFATLDDALDAVLPCLACQPAAVEMMDDILLDLTRNSREYSAYLASFLQGHPQAVLAGRILRRHAG